MKKTYSEQYDAYYDEGTNEWLEEVCGDPNCEYCMNRPERPGDLEKKLSEANKVRLKEYYKKKKMEKMFSAGIGTKKNFAMKKDGE